MDGGFERWGRLGGGKRARRDVGGGRIARSMLCVDLKSSGQGRRMGWWDMRNLLVVFVCLDCLARRTAALESARRSCGVKDGELGRDLPTTLRLLNF